MPSEMVERVARAIWKLRREEEGRSDIELEDMPKSHSVWMEAHAVIEQMRGPILEAIHDNARLAGGNDLLGRQHNKTVYAVKANMAAALDAALSDHKDTSDGGEGRSVP